MESRAVTIPNLLGLHARAAAKFVHLASTFDARITVQRGARTVDGKSILGILLLAAARGSEIVLTVDGPDELRAMAALVDFVASGFGEGA